MLPSASDLQYFLEASSTLNLSRASERLGISQPSLSLAIRRLENMLGIALFIRHKNGVSLTPSGKQLVLHARQLLQTWENTKSEVLASEQEVQGFVTLGCPTAIAIYMVSGFLAELLENHPKLEIHLKHDISRNITERVIQSSIDIGIVINPIKHPDLIIRKLRNDEFSFWISEPHKKTQDIFLCNPTLTQTDILLKKCKKAGISTKRILTMDSLEVIACLTAQGCGIGIIPECIAKYLYPNKLKRLMKMPFHMDELCMIYRSENRNVRAIQEIINTIKKFYN